MTGESFPICIDFVDLQSIKAKTPKSKRLRSVNKGFRTI